MNNIIGLDKKKELKTSLLIIGNGFDLNCKLKSSFDDFFRTKIGVIEEAVKPFTNVNCDNLWYLLFYFAFYDKWDYSSGHAIVERINKSSVLWMDVESFIKKIIVSEAGTDKWMGYHFGTRFRNYQQMFKSIYEGEDYGDDYSRSNQKQAIKKYFRTITKHIEDMYDFLFEELKKFENDFSKYIIECVHINQEYYPNCALLLNELIKNEMVSIISFNYTNCMKYTTVIEDEILNDYCNIHGDALNDIIIGYDSGDLKGNKNGGIKLSKAWQKMSCKSPLYILPSKDTVDYLKIYGHSLGPQDYSYFHSLFDYYDIYHSKITLCFYYTEYGDDERKNNRIRCNFISKIYDLLTDYARKSGNENEVTTIISRLQIENRLKIERIPKL